MLRSLPDGCAGLVYVDPPFNTGGARTGLRTTTTADATATRLGFAGRHYRVERRSGARYDDRFDDYIGWLRPRLEETRRILASQGSLYFHIDPRESHYCKVLLDEIFGRDVLSQRGGVGVRLRRPDCTQVAGETRRDPCVREGSARVSLRRVGGRARAVHGPAPADAGARRARQAAHRCVVAHHRAHVIARTDRLSDPEAARDRAPDRGRVVASGRSGAWTGARGAAPPAPPPPRWAGGSCWSTISRRRSRSCAAGSPACPGCG